MASQILFNRLIRFKAFRRDVRSDAIIGGFLIDYSKHQISGTFHKSHDADVRATGSITVYNPARSQIDLFISPTDANPIFYTFEAGYGDELKLVSEGYISKISFSHDGPDTKVNFTVSEDFPKTRTLWSEAFKLFPKNTTIATVLNTFKDLGVPIKIDNRGDLETSLATRKLKASVMIGGTNLQQEVNDILNEYGYTAAVLDRKLVVTQENSLPKSDLTDRRQLRGRGYDPNLIKLNFNTGLLQASLETVYDANVVKSYHYLSFKTMWIAELAPLSFIELNEESRYQNLKGIYRVHSTQINLNNFTGQFYIDGKAAHINSDQNKKILSSIRQAPQAVLDRAAEIQEDIAERRRNILSQFSIRDLF